jgi:hypothetical protein
VKRDLGQAADNKKKGCKMIKVIKNFLVAKKANNQVNSLVLKSQDKYIDDLEKENQRLYWELLELREKLDEYEMKEIEKSDVKEMTVNYESSKQRKDEGK